MKIIYAMLVSGTCLLVAPAAGAQDSISRMQMGDAAHTASQIVPAESGQSAFGAIHEIVEILDADPKTDWSRVDIDALRAHLIDMDNVTLHAKIAYEPTSTGERIRVSGDGDVRDSIQRMVLMHAAMAGDTPDWHMDATRTSEGALIELTSKSAFGLEKAKALGLIGMMAEGMHHARHHMMLARGTM
jgi:hypothetical protein